MVFNCLCLSSSCNTIRQNSSERSALCNMIRSLQHHRALCPLVRPRLCRRTALDALPQSLLPRVHPFWAFQPLLGLSATTSHDLVNVVHLLELDSLLSHPQARLDHCCRQRRLDRLLLRSSDVSEARFVLTSHVLHGGMRDLLLHCPAIKLLIWTVVAAAASGCFCRVLIVALILTCFHPLWVHSFQPLWVRSSHFFTLVLVKAAGSSRCFRLSVAPCTTFSLANCSLVCSMLTRVLRVVCWTGQSPCTSLSCSGPLHILQRKRARYERASPVLHWPLGRDPA